MADPGKGEGKEHLVEEAWKALRRAGGDPVELLALAKRLKGAEKFGLARRLLERAREDRDGRIDDPALSLLLRQQHALCTYKDPDLPAHLALERALRILDHEGDLASTRNQETLGLAGAIYKRKWQVDGRKAHLERSLAYYYDRGHEQARTLRRTVLDGGELPPTLEVDHARLLEGYTSINAAFVLDLLASSEERESEVTASPSDGARRRRDIARAIREELVESLPALVERGALAPGWWTGAVIVEALVGLGRDEDAQAHLREMLDAAEAPAEWMKRSTAEQLAAIARTREPAGEVGAGVVDSPAWKTVAMLVGQDPDAISSLFTGKLGLALSGGGFRASFFHIGVLARLAELDLLRHVHVLSCVSGGSIVGTHYYLEIRDRLQKKWDREQGRPEEGEVLDREDYVEVVETLARDFFAGVERNLRTRLTGSFLANLKVAFLPGYSLTDRLGELLETEIYSRVDDDGAPAARYLDELRVEPKGSSDFQPKRDNWRRRHKVPMLVLNATTLNTGHSWQFTSTWMGESPFSIDDEIDGNWRLRRVWHGSAPDEYRGEEGKRRVRLGSAVAASACVPGLFEPVALPALYPNEPLASGEREITVRLVDGGVHDNQGVTTLLEQDCRVLVVSDASGQMTSVPDPGSGRIGTLLRTNAVLMERVRQAQYHDLDARLRGGLLGGLMVLHLKKELEVDPVDWKGCEEPPDLPLRRRSDVLDYDIARGMQQKLAAVRTDLDSFTEVEARALMTSGYMMAGRYAADLGDFPVVKGEEHAWEFLDVHGPLHTRGESQAAQERVARLLDVASMNAFKIWVLSAPLKVISWVLGAAAVVAFFWASVVHRDFEVLQIAPPGGYSLTLGTIGLSVAFAVLGLVLARVFGRVVGEVAMSVIKWRTTLARLVRGLVLATAGWLVAQVHLRTFDAWFKRLGRVRNVLKGDPG